MKIQSFSHFDCSSSANVMCRVTIYHSMACFHIEGRKLSLGPCGRPTSGIESGHRGYLYVLQYAGFARSYFVPGTSSLRTVQVCRWLLVDHCGPSGNAFLVRILAVAELPLRRDCSVSLASARVNKVPPTLTGKKRSIYCSTGLILTH